MRRFILLPLVLILAGCDRLIGATQQTLDGRETGLMIYTDATTGCQYVRPAYHDGITPRMSRDGKQICN